MNQFKKKAAGKMPAAKNQKVILLCYTQNLYKSYLAYAAGKFL